MTASPAVLAAVRPPPPVHGSDGPIRHVALFTQDMSGGGAFTTVFASYARALELAGVARIDLVTVRGDPRDSEVPFPACARPVSLPGGGSAGAAVPLARYLERARPEVLISGPIIPNLAACAAKVMARRWRGRLVLSHHHPVRLARGQSWKNSPWLVRRLYPLADASFAVAPDVRDEILEVVALDPARLACIPVPVPPAAAGGDAIVAPRAGPGCPAQKSLAVLTVGRLEPVKNLRLLLQGIALARRSVPVSLTVVGEGSARPDVEAAVRELDLNGAVSLAGFVPTPVPYYRRADVFALTSEEEGFGLVLAEAMREGLAVISTDALGGGPRFLLDGGRAGRLVPRGDVGAVAAALVELADPERRRALAGAGRGRLATFAPAALGRELVTFLADTARRQA